MSDFKFVDDNPMAIKSFVITTYEALTGKTLYDGDPVRLFLLSLAQIIIQQRVLINYTAKQNLLKFAEGEFLDARGEDEGVPRLQPTPAKTTFKLSISAAQLVDYQIPAGIRGTADGQIFFATKDVVNFPAGEVEAEVTAECTIAGIIGNGLLPGQINTIVDPYHLLQSLTNITESSGGTDIEDKEAYRDRIRAKDETYSTAGPAEGYKYWAKTTSASIIDVYVSSPSDGQVELRVLLQGGQLPTQDVLDDVLATCSDETRRPLTDKVTVLAPDIITYNIDIVYWIDSLNATESLQIQNAVNKAVDDYELWQKSKLGRDINPSELIARVMKAGAKRVQVTLPAHQSLALTEVAIVENKTVTFGGLEDD